MRYLTACLAALLMNALAVSLRDITRSQRPRRRSVDGDSIAVRARLHLY